MFFFHNLWFKKFTQRTLNFCGLNNQSTSHKCWSRCEGHGSKVWLRSSPHTFILSGSALSRIRSIHTQLHAYIPFDGALISDRRKNVSWQKVHVSELKQLFFKISRIFIVDTNLWGIIEQRYKKKCC